MISEEKINKIKQVIETDSKNKNLDYFCTSRDILQARIDTFVLRTSKFIESAVIGEIGNNTFDHNWDFEANHQRGAYFNTDYESDTVILADFGRGIQASLKKVVSVADDLEALETGFTKHISGRAPEQRGNGLKFVYETVIMKGWSFYFQSGNACCRIENGIAEFSKTEDAFTGCLAIIEF